MAESHREEIAKLEALYASNPGGRVFVHLAEALRKAGEYERARNILLEGLARHDDSASGFVVLGRLHSDLQADEESEHAFRRVLQLDAGNLIAQRALADLALRNGRRDEAVARYRELLTRNPAADDVRQLLAELEAQPAEAPPPPAEAGQPPAPAPAAEPEPSWHRHPAAEAEDDGAAVEPTRSWDPPPPAAEPTGVGEPSADVWDASAEGRAGDGRGTGTDDGFPAAGDLPGDTAGEQPGHDIEHELAALDGGELTLQPTFESAHDEPSLPDAAAAAHAGPPEGAPGGGSAEDPFDRGAPDEQGLDAGLEEGAWQTPEPAGPGDVEDGTSWISPFSASPGDTDAIEFPEPEFGTIELEAQPEEVAGFPGAGSLPPLNIGSGDESGWDAGDAGWDVIVTRDADLSDLLGEVTLEQEGVGGSPVEPVDEAWQFEVRDLGSVDPAELGGDSAFAAESLDVPLFEVVEHRPDDGLDPEAGDRETEQDAGSAPEAPEAPEVVGGPSSTPPAARTETPGLLTETMADLYSRQGLHDRAAGIYRALLLRRPDDAILLARLEAAERAAGVGMAAQEPEGTEDVGDAAWLLGSGAAWAGPVPAAGTDATPYAWTGSEEQDQEEEDGAAPAPSISSYLQTLVSWTPSAGAAAEVEAAAGWTYEPDTAGEAPAPWTGGGDAAEAAGDAISGNEPLPAGPAETAEWDDAWAIEGAEDPSEAELELGGPVGEAAGGEWSWSPEDGGATGPYDDPWRVPAAPSEEEEEPVAADPWSSSSHGEREDPDARPEQQPASTAEADTWAAPAYPVNEVEAAFNEWFHGAEETGAAEPGDDGEVDARATQPGVPPSAEQAGAEEEEDEDLAMFRSWLQSLKK